MADTQNPVYTDSVTITGDGTEAHPLAAVGGGGGSPGGTDTAVQFNNAGSFGGDATAFAWDDSTDSLTITGGADSTELITVGSGGNNVLEVSGDGADNQIFIGANEASGFVAIESDTGGISVVSRGQINMGSFATDIGLLIECDGTPRVTSIEMRIGAAPGATVLDIGGDETVPKIAFFGVPLVARPTVTGSRASGAALASLLTTLASLGLLIDGTTT